MRQLLMNTSLRSRPISPSSWSSSLPAGPTNGRPCSSSWAPGRLAHEHEVRVRVPGPEHELRAARLQRAVVVVAEVVVELDQLRAALLCTGFRHPARRLSLSQAVTPPPENGPHHHETRNCRKGPSRHGAVSSAAGGRLRSRRARRARRGPRGRRDPALRPRRGDHGRRRDRRRQRAAWSGTRAAPPRSPRCGPAARGGAHVFGFHPLQTFAGDDTPDLRGIGCAIAGSTPEALETARDDRGGARDGPVRAARPQARRLPRRRVGGLELPRHAPGDGRGGRARRRPRARAGAPPARAARAHDRGQLGRARARGGAHRPGRARRRAHGHARSGRPSRPPRRSSFPSSTRSSSARGRSRHEDRPHSRRRLRRRARRPRQRVGLVPDDGLPPRGPPLAHPPRARSECDVVVVSLFVNPKQFGEGEDLDAYPRDEARDAALAEECGRRHPVRARRTRRSTPTASRPRSRSPA